MDELIGEVTLPKLVLRRVERKGVEGWEVVTFDLLRKGDLFKLWDTPGDNQVENGEQVYIAMSDPEPCGPPEQCNFVIEAENA